MQKKLYAIKEHVSTSHSAFGNIHSLFENREDAEYERFFLEKKNNNRINIIGAIRTYCVTPIEVSPPSVKNKKIYKEFCKKRKKDLEGFIEGAYESCANLQELQEQLKKYT